MATQSSVQTLTYVGDALVVNTTGTSTLSVVVTGSNSGATMIIEGSTDAINYTTLQTVTTAGTYPIAFGANQLVRARISVQGNASFVVTMNEVLAPAGFTVLGQSSVTSVTPTVTAGAYTAGNVVGGKLTFSNVFGPAFTGTLCDVLVRCKTTQTTVYTLYLFSQNPSATTWTDKAAPSINAADLPFLLGAFTVGASNSGLGTETTNQLDGINAIIQSVDQNLYGILTCSTTPTYGSTSDVTVSVRVRKD